MCLNAQPGTQKIKMLYVRVGISQIFDPHRLDPIFSESQPLYSQYKFHIYLDQFDFFFIFCETLFNMVNTHLNLHLILGWLGMVAGGNSPFGAERGGGGKGEAWRLVKLNRAGYLSTAQV